MVLIFLSNKPDITFFVFCFIELFPLRNLFCNHDCFFNSVSINSSQFLPLDFHLKVLRQLRILKTFPLNSSYNTCQGGLLHILFISQIYEVFLTGFFEIITRGFLSNSCSECFSENSV